MRRALVLPVLALAGLLGLPQARAEDASLAAADAEARRQLVAEAVAAQEAAGAAAALEAMRRSLASDRAFAAAYEPADAPEAARLEAFRATLGERALLIGEPASEDGQSDGGALGAAERLGRWLSGRMPCRVLVREPGAPEEAGTVYPFPPPAPPAGEAPAPKDGPPAGDGNGPRNGEAKGEAKGEGGEPTAANGDKPAPEAAPAAPAKPQSPEALVGAWARAVREAEGPGFVNRLIRPAACADISALLAAAERQPVYVHESLPELERHAITGTGRFLYNLPSVELRGAQADARVARMEGDKPEASLVDQAMVREKDAAVQAYKAGLEELGEVRAGLVAALDEMAIGLENWRTQAALLAAGIDETRRRLAEAGGDPAAVTARETSHLPLRLAQARESLATLEIRLLMSTAARAALRLELVERLEAALARELRWAEAVRGRYEEALLRLRTARRIDRLERDLRRLRWWRSKDAALDLTGAAEALVAADEGLIALHEVALDAVRQRRAMTTDGRATEAGKAAPAAPPNGGETAPPAEPPAAPAPRVSAVVADPAAASWDLKYLALARKELQDPELEGAFDARLVAAHYAAASAEVRRLMAAQGHARGSDALRRRFEAAAADVHAALARLEQDPLAMRVRRMPAMLASATDDFEAALTGIAEQRERGAERLHALRAYQRLLERQGTRSLLVRVDRTQRSPGLDDVLYDTRHALEDVGSWASFQGEDHLGVWVQGTWPRVLLALLAFLLAWLGTRWLRHVVDRRIERMVADLPHRSASVAEERERAKARRKHSEKAAVAITDDDVIRVPVEDTATAAEEAAPEENAGADADGEPVAGDEPTDDDARPKGSA